MRSYRVIKVRPAKFIRYKQSKIWLCKGRTLHWLDVQRKKALVLEPHNLLCYGLCQEPDLSTVEPPGVRKMVLVDLP